MTDNNNNNSINELTERNLRLLERIYQLKMKLDTDLLLENGTYLKREITTSYLPQNEPDIQKDIEETESIPKIIEHKIVEIENWYIVIDTTKSAVLDRRIKNILKEFNFEYGNIINIADEKSLYIQILDKEKEGAEGAIEGK